MPSQPPLTPEQRALRSRIAGNASWANTSDRSARTAPARDAFMDRFRREVDPDGVLDPTDRERRAESAKKAHYARMAFQSAKTRRAKAQGAA